MDEGREKQYAGIGGGEFNGGGESQGEEEIKGHSHGKRNNIHSNPKARQKLMGESLGKKGGGSRGQKRDGTERIHD